MLKNAFPIGPDGVVVDLFLLPHPLFGFLQLDFQFGRSFHGLAQCSSPFILRVSAVATASHFHTERNSGGKNLDNLRVSDHPCLALPTFRFPTLGHSCLLGFHCSEAASLTHCQSLLCITLPLPSALAPAVATALGMFGQRPKSPSRCDLNRSWLDSGCQGKRVSIDLKTQSEYRRPGREAPFD